MSNLYNDMLEQLFEEGLELFNGDVPYAEKSSRAGHCSFEAASTEMQFRTAPTSLMTPWAAKRLAL